MQATPPNRITELREAADLTITQLAAEIGRESSTLWRYENGQIEVPDEIKRLLARKFGVSIERLMGWEEVARA